MVRNVVWGNCGSPHLAAATERGPPEAAKMAAPHAAGVVAVMEAGRHLQVTLFS